MSVKRVRMSRAVGRYRSQHATGSLNRVRNWPAIGVSPGGCSIACPYSTEKLRHMGSMVDRVDSNHEIGRTR